MVLLVNIEGDSEFDEHDDTDGDCDIVLYEDALDSVVPERVVNLDFVIYVVFVIVTVWLLLGNGDFEDDNVVVVVLLDIPDEDDVIETVDVLLLDIVRVLVIVHLGVLDSVLDVL